MNQPYEPPQSDLSATSDVVETYDPKIFQMKGRIGRLRYMIFPGIAAWAYLLVVGVIVGLFALMFGSKMSDPGAGTVIALIFLGILLYVPVIVMMIVYVVRRLHDLNQTGWLSLLMIVPLVQIFFSFYLMIAPGKNEGNQYGPAPSKNPTWVVVLAIAFPVIFVLAFAAMIPKYIEAMEKYSSAQITKTPDDAVRPDPADSLRVPAENDASQPVGGTAPAPAEPAPAEPAPATDGGEAPPKPNERPQ